MQDSYNLLDALSSCIKIIGDYHWKYASTSLKQK